MDDFSDISLTIDQALIWIATRDCELVNRGSHGVAVRDRLTWMRLLLGVGDDFEFLVSPSEAETALLKAVQVGAIEAWQDGTRFEAQWFDCARVKNFLLGPSLSCGEVMRFERRRDLPHLVGECEDGSRLERPWEQIVPQFRSAALLKAFPSRDSMAEEVRASRSRTGAPGRPTSMHLIKKEFERRAAAGSLDDQLAAVAQSLVNWLKETHPAEPQMTPKTVENNLRVAFRHANATPRN